MKRKRIYVALVAVMMSATAMAQTKLPPHCVPSQPSGVPSPTTTSATTCW